MPKYEQAREDGTKGYVVEISNWGRDYERVIYAKTSSEARRKADPRCIGGYVRRVTRRLAQRVESGDTNGAEEGQ